MSKKKHKLRVRFRLEPPERAPAPVRRFLIDRETGAAREIKSPKGHSRQNTYEELSLLESEKARLREMAFLLSSDRTDLRERGEEKLGALAQLLAAARSAKIGSAIGTQKRRDTGQRKARIVEAAAHKGIDPVTLISERQLRRIKNQHK